MCLVFRDTKHTRQKAVPLPFGVIIDLSFDNFDKLE
jgi:hypothetical protein